MQSLVAVIRRRGKLGVDEAWRDEAGVGSCGVWGKCGEGGDMGFALCLRKHTHPHGIRHWPKPGPVQESPLAGAFWGVRDIGPIAGAKLERAAAGRSGITWGVASN